MNPEREEEIIREAVRQGYLNAEGLELFDRMTKRYGQRLGSLIGVGRLDAEVVREIEELIGPEPEHAVAVEPPAVDLAPSATVAISGHRDYSGETCGKYELIELLGEGLAGQVYRAVDPAANREVAVKLLFGDDPAVDQRNAEAARRQAQVDHASVCAIYEVGELSGKPFIVSHLATGRALSSMSAELTLDERVDLAAQVAAALETAHGKGLIHGNLRPTNIFVEENEEGQWQACVTDFGMTRPGAVTAYTAPEQLNAKQAAGDARSDVYALGATIYHVLTGRPPFEGSNHARLVKSIRRKRPAPLRKLQRDVSEDLEILTRKCLEKDPGKRYQEAGALADDLDRVLDGEPISERPPTLGNRWAAWIRRHRMLIAGGIAAIVLLAAAGAEFQRRRGAAARLASISIELWRKAGEAESILRDARREPLHDIRGETALARRVLFEIDEIATGSGPEARAIASFARARIHLALGEYTVAAALLHETWESGVRTPDVAAALGLAIGSMAIWSEEIYHGSAESRGGVAMGKRVSASAARAASWLHQGAASTYLPDEYRRGLGGFYNSSTGEALAAAAMVPAGDWAAESRMLTAWSHTANGDVAAERGDGSAAMEAYLQAEKSWREAIGMAASDHRAREGLALLWLRRMRMQGAAGNPDPLTERDEALSSVELAIRIDPDHHGAYLVKSTIWWTYGRIRLDAGLDPTEPLAAAATAAREALQRQPLLAAAQFDLAMSRLLMARYLRTKGADASEALGDAMNRCRRALALDPSFSLAHSLLGESLRVSAVARAARGEDPIEPLREALDLLHKALALSPRSMSARIDLASALLDMARYERLTGKFVTGALQESLRRFEQTAGLAPDEAGVIDGIAAAYEELGLQEYTAGRDPTSWLDRSIAALEEAGRQEAALVASIARVYRERAEYELDVARDATSSIALALANAEKSVSLDDRNAGFQEELGAAWFVKARMDVAKGQPWSTPMAGARAALARATAIDPRRASAHRLIAATHLFEAEAGGGGRKDRALESARAALGRALSIEPSDPAGCMLAARLARLRAEAAGADAASVAVAVKEGLQMVTRSLAGNPRLAEAHLVAGQLHLLDARAQADTAPRIAAAGRAADSLKKAVAINPLLGPRADPALQEATNLVRGE